MSVFNDACVSFRRFVKKRSTGLSIGIILLICCGVYANTLFNDFVYDDMDQVLGNHWIKSPRYIGDVFIKPVWAFRGIGQSNYYRPVMHLIYMLNYQVFGIKPWGFHLTNILFHAGASVLVLLIVSLLLKQTPLSFSGIVPSFIAALLFATHPIHTEVVAWVAAIPELSFSFFCLLALYLYMRGRADARNLQLLSVASFLLALFSKETAIMLPVIVIVYDLCFWPEEDRMYYRLKRYAPYFLVAGFYLILRFNALGGLTQVRRHAELSNYEYLINVFPLFGLYLQKLLVPLGLNAFHAFSPINSLSEVKGVLSVAAAAAFIGLTALALRKDRLVFYGFVIVAVPLIPALYIPGLGENTFAERYLYLPSFGFAFLCALAMVRLRPLSKRASVAVGGGLIALALAYSVGTVQRNYVWKDNLTLWTDTVKKSPTAAGPHRYFGEALLDKGLADRAIEQFFIALQSNPDSPGVHNNLAAAYTRKDQRQDAFRHVRIALALQPQLAEAHLNLGVLYDRDELHDKAIQEFRIAVQLNPNSPDANRTLGIAYGEGGMLEEAVKYLEAALQLNPDDAEAHNNTGVAYAKMGLMDKALEHFKAAVELDPSDPDYRKNVAKAGGRT